ncbi:hypothetical protein [Yoonia sp. 2307UL14-13]|uniref:hypothetical protein n=1 Tax=Yoonia sp. 2307UL14-13 TaxID=3126506 RepID=UPI003095BC00
MGAVVSKQNHLSELRFVLVAALAVLFGPFLSFVIVGHFNSPGGSDVQISLMELLQGLGGFLTIQFTFGLLLLIPTLVLAFVMGFTLWRLVVSSLLDYHIPPRICALCTAVLVTISVAVVTDLLLGFAIGVGGGLDFLVTRHFAAGAIIVAVIGTQVLMVPTE